MYHGLDFDRIGPNAQSDNQLKGYASEARSSCFLRCKVAGYKVPVQLLNQNKKLYSFR